MAVDLYGRNGVVDRATLNEHLDLARQCLGSDLRLISSSVKMRKLLFEVEAGGRRVIGKVSYSKSSTGALQHLNSLRDAGMQPPSRYTVPEPLGWFADRKLLLQEKAPGKCVLDAMTENTGPAEHVLQAAQWLKALWDLKVAAAEQRFDLDDALSRSADLAAAMDPERVEELTQAAIKVLARPANNLVPSHGDYHPMNIFVSPERVTVIDVDTFALREREFDAGYFLAQLANFGLIVSGTIEATRDLRALFWKECGDLDETRVSAYMAWTLLKSLHYDLCILRIENERAEAMTAAAGQLLEAGSPNALS